MAVLSVELDHRRPYVVTGARSGVGAAVARLLRKCGATVVSVDLAPAGSSHSEDHVAGDVAEASTWDLIRQRVAEASPDGAAGLITCAGSIVVKDLATVTPVDFERLFRVNTLGVLLGIQTLLPAMAERGSGSLVAVASVDAMFAEVSMSAYATSKGALLQLVRSTAVEYARYGIRVNAVCPGAIDTPLLQEHFATAANPRLARRQTEMGTPLGRLLTAEEIANVLVFLSSQSASAMAGAAVVVDGGLTATYDFHA